MTRKLKVAVIGLGYVGLPLAVEFSKKRKIIGFDINKYRVKELSSDLDLTNEVSSAELKKVKSNITYTTNIHDLQGANFFIATVPTPIDHSKNPDFSYLESAAELIGGILKKGDIVVFESTVYPGATQEICTPILEMESGLKLDLDFSIGYSPERINPGDQLHKLPNIKKITSGSNPKAARIIDDLYSTIIKAGTVPVSSIETAEAAKVIENTQRDLNIALANELSLIFQKMDIDTKEVIDAAASKWNFSKFYPGLVGGHCIGVDPYYLTFKAKKLGYEPKVILSGRELNDSMSKNVVSQLCNMMRKQKILLSGANILVLGFTFKENCPDTRNSKVYDLVSELQRKKMNVHIHDPVLNQNKIRIQHPEFKFIKSPKIKFYDSIIIAVAHDDFKKLGPKRIKQYAKNKHILFDLKSLFSITDSDLRL